MSGHGFPGGLRLDLRKIASASAVRQLSMPQRLCVPLLQHAGEPARPCVAVGDRIAKGQRIGEAMGALSAHVHAPTSGEVTAIVERPIGHPSGRALPCVELRADGQDRWSRLPSLHDWPQLGGDVIARRLREAGVVGLGGALFPTDLKLAGDGSPIDILIVNGAECEPYIACDDALLRSRAEEVLAGGVLLGHALAARRVVLAVEDVMTAALSALQQARAAQTHAVELVAVPTRYPQGGERQLIRHLTGIEIAAGALPRTHGVLCVNVATAASAWRAVVHGEAVVSRIVSVTGRGVHRPCNLETPLGTPIADLVAAAGGYTASAQRLVLGGPMMGVALDDDTIPIGKGSHCVLVMAADEVAAGGAEMPCIRCGECVRVCPVRLLPQHLHLQIQAGGWTRVQDLGLTDCIECGLCAFICPSWIPLVESFRYGKGELAWQARERAAAERARAQFEERNARLTRQAEQRAQRLDQRDRIAATGELPDPLASALARADADGKRGS